MLFFTKKSLCWPLMIGLWLLLLLVCIVAQVDNSPVRYKSINIDQKDAGTKGGFDNRDQQQTAQEINNNQSEVNLEEIDKNDNSNNKKKSFKFSSCLDDLNQKLSKVAVFGQNTNVLSELIRELTKLGTNLWSVIINDKVTVKKITDARQKENERQAALYHANQLMFPKPVMMNPGPDVISNQVLQQQLEQLEHRQRQLMKESMPNHNGNIQSVLKNPNRTGIGTIDSFWIWAVMATIMANVAIGTIALRRYRMQQQNYTNNNWSEEMTHSHQRQHHDHHDYHHRHHHHRYHHHSGSHRKPKHKPSKETIKTKPI